jgi:hypothetical protein
MGPVPVRDPTPKPRFLGHTAVVLGPSLGRSISIVAAGETPCCNVASASQQMMTVMTMMTAIMRAPLVTYTSRD